MRDLRLSIPQGLAKVGGAVGTGRSPQKEQACLKLLERLARWQGEQVGGEGDRMVQVLEGLTKRLQLLQGGPKELGDTAAGWQVRSNDVWSIPGR